MGSVASASEGAISAPMMPPTNTTMGAPLLPNAREMASKIVFFDCKALISLSATAFWMAMKAGHDQMLLGFPQAVDYTKLND
jgi:hypothetical protein